MTITQRPAHVPSRAETLWLVGVPAALLAAYFAVLASRYIHIFLLIEYRQWIFGPNVERLLSFIQPAHLFDPPSANAHFSIPYSRSFSFMTVFLFGTICGPTPVCHNTIHLALLLFAALFSVLTVRKLSVSGNAMPQLVTGAVTLLSVPVVDAMTWQATILDKMAMLLTAATLFAAASIKLDSPTPVRLLVVNCVLFLLVVAAYNSKEAALFLAPSVTLLVGCRLIAAGLPVLRACGRTLAFVALPLAYAVAHVGLVYHDRAALTDEYARVTAGNLAENASLFAAQMLDRFTTYDAVETPTSLALVLAVVVIGAIALAFVTRRGPLIPLPLWAAVGLVGALAIPLRTTAPSAFYLLVPMVYFGLLMGLTADAFLAGVSGRIARTGVMIACVTLLGARAVTLRAALPSYDHLAELSARFEDTLRGVGKAIAADRPSRIVFIRTTEDPVSYMFVTPPKTDHALAPYLLSATSDRTERLRLDRIIEDVPPYKPVLPKPGDLQVYLGPALQLDRMVRVPEGAPSEGE